MQNPTVKIIIPSFEEDQAGKSILPTLSTALGKASFKVHDIEVGILSSSLLELLDSLDQVVNNVLATNKDVPSIIAFSLGVDMDGSVGIMSTVATSLSHNSSITVEFDLNAMRQQKSQKGQ